VGLYNCTFDQDQTASLNLVEIEKHSVCEGCSKKPFSCRIFASNLLFYNRSAYAWKGFDVRTDAELVNAVLDGEKQAFAVLVKRYERQVRAVALDVLGDYHSAADVSQEAFVKAYERIAGLRKPKAFGPWLMKITRRIAFDSARRKPKETQLEPKIVTSIEGPNGQLDENKQRLLAAVVKLPKSEKQVVMLRYLDNNSVKDVADIVGRSVGTVTKQLSRAHKHLRKILERSEK
jgi:RNA polymerase sigma-70 factor (ECF subfamily)